MSDRPEETPTEPTCSRCKAPVTWTTTEATATKPSRRMPVDRAPVPNGNIILIERPGQEPLAKYLKKDDYVLGLTRYQSHFVSCPYAGQFRKR